MRFYGGGAFPDGPIDTRRVAQSRELMNYLGVLSAMYYQASADYAWMSARITEIGERLGSAVE